MRSTLTPFLLLALVACGGKDDEGDSGTEPTTQTGTATGTDTGPATDTPDPTVPTDPTDTTPSATDDAASALIGAAGGEVTLSDVTLAIPAGALAADTTITLAASTDTTGLPDASTIMGRIFDFGPDGTTFAVPVPLSIELSGALGTGEVWAISTYDEVAGAWVDVPTSDDGVVATANLEHFSRWTLRKVALAELTCALPVACGGDPTGSYAGGYTECTIPTGYEQHALQGTCADIGVVYAETFQGGYHFFAGGSWNVDGNVTSVAWLDVPTSCFGPLGIGVCSELNDATMTCLDAATGCTCTDVFDTGSVVSIGSWQINATGQIQASSAPLGQFTFDFCVNGDGSVDFADTRSVTHLVP